MGTAQGRREGVLGSGEGVSRSLGERKCFMGGKHQELQVQGFSKDLLVCSLWNVNAMKVKDG